MKDIMGEISVLLRPAPKRIEEAEGRARRLAKALRNRRYGEFRIGRIMEYGSVFRGTALSAFADVDLLLVIDPESLGGVAGSTPSATGAIRNLAEFLQRRHKELAEVGKVAVWSQRHSVGVEYPEYRIRVDLVPALPTNKPDIVCIPKRDSSEWIQGCPRGIRERLDDLSISQPRVITAIRFLKGWRRAQELRKLNGYAVELLAVQAADDDENLSATRIVRRVWEGIARSSGGRHMRLMGARGKEPVNLIDPWTGANVLTGLHHQDRHQLAEAAEAALEDLRSLIQSVRAGDREWALKQAKRLFVGRQWESRAKSAQRGELFVGAKTQRNQEIPWGKAK